MPINISKCNTGLFLKSASSEFKTVPVHINNCFTYGVHATTNSVVSFTDISATGPTGPTFGSTLSTYNIPTAVLVTNGSNLEFLKNARISSSFNGVIVSSNSSGFVQDNEIIASSTIGTTTVAGILTQTSYLQAFDNTISGFGTATGPSGPTQIRTSLQGTVVVESTATQAKVSHGILTTGISLVDTAKGTTYLGGQYHTSILAGDEY